MDLQAASSSAQPPASKAPRVLACVLCQQRKVKCDRKFPCANCTKHKVQCVPATQARRRRRRFPERDLLGRLRRYEDLLRQHNIKFDPLHGSPSIPDREYGGDSSESEDEHPRSSTVDSSPPAATPRSEGLFEAKSIWNAISQDTHGGDGNANSLETTVKAAMEMDRSADGDNFLFGSRSEVIDLSTFHPEPLDIFRLWQIYLDNVNPLLKVTHTSELQGRIVEAARDVKKVSPTMEALMFSIYSISVKSLSEEECRSMFELSKEDLMTKYLFGCQQALMNARFLQSRERDCLTALFIYLLSVRTKNPRTLCVMFGVVMRIAMNMGIHRESLLANSGSEFEIEMRRRLWWSLVVYDARRCEMSDFKDALLAPTWDCKLPLNVNDFDLRPGMKELPSEGAKVTEAIFAVVRSEIGEFLRHSPYFLEFSNPALKPIAKELPEGGSISALESKIEEEYLRFCDMDNPIHYMTVWYARAQFAKSHLLEHYCRYADSPIPQTDEQLDHAMEFSFTMLDCDTRLMSSSHSKGFSWFLMYNFPFPAYMHVIFDLKRRPNGRQARRAWEIMSDNYDLRIPQWGKAEAAVVRNKSPVLKMFCGMIYQAWDALKAATGPGVPLEPPRIIQKVQEMESFMMQLPTQEMDKGHESTTADLNSVPLAPMSDVSGLDPDNFFFSMPTGFADDSLMFDMTGQGMADFGPVGLPGMTGQEQFQFLENHLNWRGV